EELVARRARCIEPFEFLKFGFGYCRYLRNRFRKIFREKINCERIEVIERFAGEVRVEQNNIAPILFGHVTVSRNEAIYAAVMTMRYDTSFHFRVIREAIAEAKSVA